MTTTAVRPEAGMPGRVATGRLISSELRWLFRRPRTLIVLGLFAAVPIVVGLAVSLTGGPQEGNGPEGPGGNLLSVAAGNSLILPVATLTLALGFLLPLGATMAGADALAGESAQGTLRGWLIAPVSRGRLLLVKASGVAAFILVAVLAMSVVGVLMGFILNGTDSLVTISGTSLGFGSALGKIAVAAGWVSLQLFAVGAVALAISACTEHPMVVVTSVIAGDIVFGVLSMLDAVSWLHPFLLTNQWQEGLVDVLRDPMPTGMLTESALRACCYIVIGISIGYARLTTKDG